MIAQFAIIFALGLLGMVCATVANGTALNSQEKV